MPNIEPSKTSGRSARRGQSTRGSVTPREPARGEAVVGQETSAEEQSKRETDEEQRTTE